MFELRANGRVFITVNICLYRESDLYVNKKSVFCVLCVCEICSHTERIIAIVVLVTPADHSSRVA